MEEGKNVLGIIKNRWLFSYILVTLLCSGCASVNYGKYNASDKLIRYNDLSEMSAFIEKRKHAVDKIDSYPTKSEFWDKFKFRKRTGLEEVVVYGVRASLSEAEGLMRQEDFITNTQERFVDEGGIVKRIGDFMIIFYF